MRDYVLIIILALLVTYGCSRKQETQPAENEELIEQLPQDYSDEPIEVIMPKTDEAQIAESIQPEQTVLPETTEVIQLALKNAGFYEGKIDSVIGPKTIQAIKDFQEQNNLPVDGKVGPMTWAVLKGFLTLSAQPVPAAY